MRIKVSLGLSLMPLVAIMSPLFAQAAGLDEFIARLHGWVGQLIPIVFALCLLVFLWGLVMFIAKSGDETERKEGKQKMLWGIIALFVAVSIWGIVGFIGSTIGITPLPPPPPPVL